MKKQQKQTPQRIAKYANPKQVKLLDKIEVQIKFGDLQGAREALQHFIDAYPSVIDGWELALDFAQSTNDGHLSYYAGAALLALEPGEEINHYNAALIAGQLGMPFTCLHHCETYLKRFPTGGAYKRVEELYRAFKEQGEKLLREDEMARGITDIEALRLFEHGQVLVTSGKTAEGLKVSLEASKRLPNAIPPLNNVSLGYAIIGQIDEALEYADEALRRESTNLNARANKAQYLMRLGRREEAQPLIDALKLENPDNLDHWGKILETLAYAGDDQGIVDLYLRAERAHKEQQFQIAPLAQHFAAVAHARLGNERGARELWRATLKAQPNHTLAKDNLFDLALPVSERNGAWYFPMHQWFLQRWLGQFYQLVTRLERKPDALKREVAKLIGANPAMEVALGALLEQGDLQGRELALRLADFVPLEGLGSFALGQRGTDEQRTTAARLLVQHGLLDGERPVKLYVEGAQKEVSLIEIEIYEGSGESDLPDGAQEHLEASVAAYYEAKYETALVEVEAALAIAPDTATLMNQKSVVLVALKQEREAETLMRKNAELHPDYLFARCAMSRFAVIAHKLDEADEWLKPLRTMRRFHVSEYRAYMYAQITLIEAKGEKKAAGTMRAVMMKMLEEFEYDDDD